MPVIKCHRTFMNFIYRTSNSCVNKFTGEKLLKELTCSKTLSQLMHSLLLESYNWLIYRERNIKF